MASEIKLFPTLALPDPVDIPVADKKPMRILSKYKTGAFNTQDSMQNIDLPGLYELLCPVFINFH
jgi:hypothetical protein